MVQACPLCRTSPPTIVESTFVNKVKKSIPTIRAPTLFDTIRDICSGDAKVLIFTRNASVKLTDILTSLKAKTLRGTAESRNKIIKEYKTTNTCNVVFVESVADIAGMRFENTSDIILLYEPNDEEMVQIVGRGVRMNRREGFPLTVNIIEPR